MTQNPDIQSALKRLAILAKTSKARPRARGATAKDIRSGQSKLSLPIPGYWLEILRVWDGARLDDIFLATVLDLWGCHETHEEEVRENNPGVKQGLLYVGGKMSGDYLAVDTTSITKKGDCRVVLVSHEPDHSFPIIDEWPSVVAFLDEMLAAAEALRASKT